MEQTFQGHRHSGTEIQLRNKLRPVVVICESAFAKPDLTLVKCRMDRLSVAGRSRQMSLVKSKNTGPELAVRKLVFSMGYRYRLHGARLPGTPDLVFARRKKVVFVHGCFWHRHAGCKKDTTPASNTEYWLPKFARTVERDRQTLDSLQARGWSALVVWACELKDTDVLAAAIGGEGQSVQDDRLAGERSVSRHALHPQAHWEKSICCLQSPV